VLAAPLVPSSGAANKSRRGGGSFACLALPVIRSRPCAAPLNLKGDRRQLGQNEGIDGLIVALNHNADLLTGTNGKAF
jgi:hypothetical protein